jgi:hypothetical protein
MSKAGVDGLDTDGKKEIATTYNTLAGLLAGLSFTVLFFYIDKDLNLDILSGAKDAIFNFVTIILLIAQCLLFLFASVIYSDAVKIAIGARLECEVSYVKLIQTADNLTFIAFIMLMINVGLVTMRLDMLLGVVAIVVEGMLFIMFVNMDKAQFHSKRKK